MKVLDLHDSCRALTSVLSGNRVQVALAASPTSDSNIRPDFSKFEEWKAESRSSPILDPRDHWERLFQLESAPSAEKLASRLALSKVLKTIARSRPERISASISHTVGVGIAAASSSSSAERFTVGVDIERADRPISSAVYSRMSHPEERVEGLLPIGVWAAKEAVFKAARVSRFAAIQLELVSVGSGLWRGTATDLGENLHLAVAVGRRYCIACALYVATGS